MGVEKTASVIHGKLAEVTSEAMINLHKRNQKIQLTVEESKVKIEESQITTAGNFQRHPRNRHISHRTLEPRYLRPHT